MHQSVKSPTPPYPGNAGHLSGFRPPLLPRFGGLSTTLDTIIISYQGSLAGVRQGFASDAILDLIRTQRMLEFNVIEYFRCKIFINLRKILKYIDFGLHFVF